MFGIAGELMQAGGADMIQGLYVVCLLFGSQISFTLTGREVLSSLSENVNGTDRTAIATVKCLCLICWARSFLAQECVKI